MARRSPLTCVPALFALLRQEACRRRLRPSPLRIRPSSPAAGSPRSCSSAGSFVPHTAAVLATPRPASTGRCSASAWPGPDRPPSACSTVTSHTPYVPGPLYLRHRGNFTTHARSPAGVGSRKPFSRARSSASTPATTSRRSPDRRTEPRTLRSSPPPGICAKLTFDWYQPLAPTSPQLERFFSRTCGRGCVVASAQVCDIERVRRTCRIGTRTLS